MYLTYRLDPNSYYTPVKVDLEVMALKEYPTLPRLESYHQIHFRVILKTPLREYSQHILNSIDKALIKKFSYICKPDKKVLSEPNSNHKKKMIKRQWTEFFFFHDSAFFLNK